MSAPSVAATGFAVTNYTEALARLRFLRSRLSLVLRCYGAYMVRAERAFNRWATNPVANGPAHEQAYRDYIKASSRAAHMHARHSQLAARILGGAR